MIHLYILGVVMIKEKKDEFKKLVYLLASKLKHRDYVSAMSYIHTLRLGNLTLKQTNDVMREVMFNPLPPKQFKKFTCINGGKSNKK